MSADDTGLCRRCGKVLYPNRGEARTAAAAQRARGRDVSVYHDDRCGCWHLTSRHVPPTPGKRRRHGRAS